MCNCPNRRTSYRSNPPDDPEIIRVGKRGAGVGRNAPRKMWVTRKNKRTKRRRINRKKS